MNITILYSCDNHHTSESRFPHGAFTSRETALEAIKELLETDKQPPLSPDDETLFLEYGQTQAYEGSEGQFTSENVTLDEIETYF